MKAGKTKELDNFRKALEEIAKLDALYALENENIAKLFVEKPEMVVKAFERIAEFAGKEAFWGLGSLTLHP
ncbi:MAG: hypothetical protein QXH27_01235 [Candidatus Micrarchaeia archaeon]